MFNQHYSARFNKEVISFLRLHSVRIVHILVFKCVFCTFVLCAHENIKS